VGSPRLPEVVACHHITGNFDYLLQVEVADLSVDQHRDVAPRKLGNSLLPNWLWPRARGGGHVSQVAAGEPAHARELGA
jgi:hypothetical protein